LPLLGQFERPSLPPLGDFHRFSRQVKLAPCQGEVPGGVSERSGGENACAKGEQLSPHRFPCGLQVERTRRASDRPDIMRGNQVSDWPDSRHDENNASDDAHNQYCCTVGTPQPSKPRHHGTTVRAVGGRAISLR
jgi:hypothetical protein